MLRRLLHFILRLICEWRGHDEAHFDAPLSVVDLRPGRILKVPTPNLIEPYPVPVIPAKLAELMPLAMRERYFMYLLNPPIKVHRMYCLRCGEAWD